MSVSVVAIEAALSMPSGEYAAVCENGERGGVKPNVKSGKQEHSTASKASKMHVCNKAHMSKGGVWLLVGATDNGPTKFVRMNIAFSSRVFTNQPCAMPARTGDRVNEVLECEGESHIKLGAN